MVLREFQIQFSSKVSPKRLSCDTTKRKTQGLTLEGQAIAPKSLDRTTTMRNPVRSSFVNL